MPNGHDSRRALRDALLARAGLTRDTDRIERRAPEAGPLPLSFEQERIWFLDHVDPLRGPYTSNDPLAFRIQGRLDRRALARALAEIARRHPVWRATYTLGDAGPTQRFASETAIDVPDDDASALGSAARAERLAEIAACEARHPFDLGNDRPVRCRLVKTAADEHVLLVTMHQIVVDGWADHVLLTELATLHEAFSQGARSPLPEPAIGYADFVRWQRARMTGDAYERRLELWQRRLDGLPSPLRLGGRRRPAWPRYEGARHARTVSPQVLAELKAIARGEDASLYMIVLAAFQTILWAHTAAEDFVVGTPITTRVHPDLENLCGYFVDILPVRARVDGDASFHHHLRGVRETVLAAFAERDVPFQRIVEVAAPPRVPGRTPLVPVMFALQDFEPTFAHAAPTGRWEAEWLYANTSKFDLMLEAFPSTSGLLLRFEYDTELLEPATVEQVAADLATLLAGLSGGTDRSLRELVPERAQTPVEPETVVAAPLRSTGLVTSLLDLWRDLLANPAIKPHDDFFAVGGHSLLATVMLERACALAGARVPLRRFLERPSVAVLASVLEEARSP